MQSRDNFSVKFQDRNYDLKKFMRDHPGGVNTLKHYEGRSIHNAMEKFGHSLSAYHILNDLKVDSVDANLTGQLSGNGRIITNEEASRDPGEIEFLEDLEGYISPGHHGGATSRRYQQNVPLVAQPNGHQSRLDWSKPILGQLEAISPHYDKWVNTSVYRKCHLFANPLLEAMTYTPWYLVPMFWIPIIGYLGVTQYFENVECGNSCKDPLSILQFLLHLAQGVLIWTAVEYSLHRWVFHMDPGSSITMMKIHFVLHGMHHKVPFDSLRQVFPPLAAFVIAATLFSCLRYFLTYPMVKLAGALFGYLTYDMIHFYVHHGSPKDGTYLYAMKRYHTNHHFVNHDKAFGISCKLWDYIFRTFVTVKNLNFSLSWNL